ncbi:MAG: HAD-IA family hydrolase [Acidimicrobiales bacterium]
MIFDVDGTLVDSERHGHRVAFNAAFDAFGLGYRWDEDVYGSLLRVTGGQRRIAGYLAAQGVPESERTPLAAELHGLKTRLLVEMIEAGRLAPRPGVRPLLEELLGVGVRLAVATTGSRPWVESLLNNLLAGIEFEAVVTGDEVATRKPDPEAFHVALNRLGLGPDAVVAVEDSHEGLLSAVGAGLATVVVTNGYTAEHDLAGAALVVDSFDPELVNLGTLADLLEQNSPGGSNRRPGELFRRVMS